MKSRQIKSPRTCYTAPEAICVLLRPGTTLMQASVINAEEQAGQPEGYEIDNGIFNW